MRTNSASDAGRAAGSTSMRVAATTLGLGLGLAAATLAHDPIFHGRAASASVLTDPAAGPAPAASSTVRLPEGKFAAAGVVVVPARMAALAAEVGVTGRIEANADRRVEIRPRVSGVIREVHVVLGAAVRAGDLLATLDSGEVAAARFEVRAHRRALATARSEADWASTIAANVDTLVPELRKGTPAKALESQFADRPLGSSRSRLLSAYAEFEIASHEERKQSELFRKQIVGEHPAVMALHAREAAQAKLEAELEQVRYDSGHAKRLADQKVRDADAEVADADQRLRILGVVDAKAEPNAGAEVDVEALSAYRIAAPFDGRIIARSAVPSQRVEPADALMTLADLSTVRVSIDVPESTLASLPAPSVGGDGAIRLTAGAYPGREFTAKVLSVGALVDPTTRTVPVLAEAADPEGLLKLGLFVRVVLAGPSSPPALTVPGSAVVEVAGRTGVFVPEGSDGRTFNLRPIEVGREAQGRRVVLAGLVEGTPVVSAGAFLLKSELILQAETEED